MGFNTAAFVLFFAAFCFLYYFVARTVRLRLWLIALASIGFYASWSYKFVPILLGTGLLDFYLAQRIAAEEKPWRKQRLLALSLIANLGVLGYFKYANFFIENLTAALNAVGVHLDPFTIKVVAPLGISFYTFQSISYTVDVYFGTFLPRKKPLEFIASLTFFPHLISGPIVRASKLVPQFASVALPTRAMVKDGFMLIAAGLLKKTVADLLAPTVEHVFGAHKVLSAIETWTGVLAFAAQVYGDFAGYSDIAIGVALVLGFSLPENFRLPYFSTSIVDFWKRWHMTLSSWLQDYVFVPFMARYRRPYLGILLTMVVAGVWHGAGWPWILFGLYHGTLSVLTHWVRSILPDSWSGVTDSIFVRVLQVLLTFYLVVVGMVLWRSETLPNIGNVLRGMHHSSVRSEFDYSDVFPLVAVIAALVLSHVMDYLLRRYDMLKRRPILWSCWVVFCLAFTIALGKSGASFIYFEF